MSNFPINAQPTYDPFAVQPMRDELTSVGFNELMTPEDVDNAVGRDSDETVLVMINSVCGCAAGSARPGVSLALQNKRIPNHIYTVFAGQEKAAVEHLRTEYLSQFPPSSPAVALFRKGEVVAMVHRYQIEGHSAEQIANALVEAFNELCTGEGPSVSPEHFSQVQHAKACGSKIPKYSGA